MTTAARKEWRRVFTNTILALAEGELDLLEAASWAIQAQHKYADRDPVDAAEESFENGKPPPIFPS
jgi:hypothetical protein